MIKGSKKNKIVDVVFVESDISLLEHRIHNTYEFVHKIVLVIGSEKEVLVSLNSKITPWIDKISVLHSEETDVYNKNNINKIKNFIVDYEFEDLICFSKLNELPDYENFEEVTEQIIFGPVVLRNTNLKFNTSLYTKNRHMGTICVNYSQLLDYKTDLSTLNDGKQNIITSFFNIVDNGYNFEGFSKNNGNTSLPVNTYKGPITFSKDYLKEIFPKNLCDKKTLVIFNMNQEYVDISKLDQYSKILNFNFTKDYRLKNIETNEELTTINIFLPPKPLYDTTTIFNLSFGLQEIQKFLIQMEFLGCQKIDFVSYPLSTENGLNETKIWEDFSNSNFVETFYEKLSEFV